MRPKMGMEWINNVLHPSKDFSLVLRSTKIVEKTVVIEKTIVVHQC